MNAPTTLINLIVCRRPSRMYPFDGFRGLALLEPNLIIGSVCQRTRTLRVQLHTHTHVFFSALDLALVLVRVPLFVRVRVYVFVESRLPVY